MEAAWHTFFSKLADSVRATSKLEAMLEPGDIFVSSMAPPKNVRSLQEKIFRAVSSGSQGEWTHAGLYVGGGKVIEMRDRMQTRPLSRAFRSVDAKFLRPNVPAAVRAGAAEKLLALTKSQKGRVARYATKGTLARAFIERVTPGKMLNDKKIRKSNRYTCSHLVAEAYEGAVDFGGKTKKDLGLVMPVDLAQSAHARPIVTYRNRSRKDRKP